MLNEIGLEGFDIVHYSKFGGSIRMACISVNRQASCYILDHVSKNDRVIVFGTYNQYKYQNPAGDNKVLQSIVLHSCDSVKLVTGSEKEIIIPKQKIGFPEGTVKETAIENGMKRNK